MSSSEDDGNPEGEPLLIADTDISSEPLLRDGRQETGIQPAKPLSRLVFYFMAIHFLLAFAEIILVAPLIRLFENSLCLSHYGFPIGGVEEALCKIKEVQRPLATIRGWKSTFDTIPVLLVAIPVGRLGDHHGRRQIMAMALLGVVGSLVEIFVVCAFPKTFPLRLVWLSSAILLFGGGLNSASAFMWAMVTESIPSEGRSHAFYYIFSAFYVAELISSSIASVTLDISPWIPCGLAMGSIVACLALLALMPDPRAHSQNSRQEAPAYPLESLMGQSSVKGLFSALSNRNIQLTIPVFLVGIFRYAMLNILIQYASVRFGLRISTGATFYTETAVVNIFLFSFLVPQLTAHIRHRFKVQPHVIDLFLVRTSVALMCIGCLAIGLAQTSALLPFGVLVFAAGFGSRVSALALVSSWVSDDSKATMFAGIVVLESLGHAVGDPAIQQIFAASLLLPPFWMAMPFFVGAGLYCIARVSSSFIRLERSVGEDSGELVSSPEIGQA
ncbi:MFS multidrug transporter [Drepanopeziza brunnea f. sp. 'multigermtubi' MB_m1]|uniref:MFS multidrug transporter n=1 Tax=Marssonina brunnea f. sp. multigermtubi (strain MB_m1) TaxID=1072389 RepID=K1Y9B9_MARBU|nr:MFS multidrug transporter [Drepanopeziza brunnea f. sp. 'multigermtubi' MB_m1]EKD21754.1 MFS multidrug transporter [Drepanopeziza brunnea f. sp. 'multigermtubi' MB_m1]